MRIGKLNTFCLNLVFQRQAKYSENKLKCTKARNDYLLNLAATNAAVSKYYIHDVSDLIDVSTKVILFYSSVISNENDCILDCGHALMQSYLFYFFYLF